MPMTEQVNHPAHYGGADDPFECIKVIEAWQLDFHTGNAVKYIGRAGKKDAGLTAQDLKKAIWYLQRKVGWLEPNEVTDAPRNVRQSVTPEQAVRNVLSFVREALTYSQDLPYPARDLSMSRLGEEEAYLQSVLDDYTSDKN